MDKNEIMCISFFDLLGTKAAAQQGPEIYEELITQFKEVLARTIKEFGERKVTLWAFSDCAYVETESVAEMIQFYQYLRKETIASKIFFVGAMDRGCLKASTLLELQRLSKSKTSPTDTNTRVNGFFFTGPDTTRIYAQQATLAGIGVACSEKIIATCKDMVCSSYYFETRECTNLVRFWDIKYDLASVDLLEHLISQLIQTHYEIPQASRYYLSAIITMLKSLDIDQLESTDFSSIVALCCFNHPFFSKMKNSFKRETEIFIMVILQLLVENKRIISNYKTQLKTAIDNSKMDVADIIELYHNKLVRQVIEPQNQAALLKDLVLFHYE